MKKIIFCRAALVFIAAVLCFTAAVLAQPAWDGLESEKSRVARKVASFEILGDPVETHHMYFERGLDAPDFFNFVSYERNKLIGLKRTNQGTCYGISIFTIRYFQWFILPHLLSDEELARVNPGRCRLPSYALRVARDFGLPEWVLKRPVIGEKTARERREQIAPWRLRTLLTGRKKFSKAVSGKIKQHMDASKYAKLHSIRMFDNQGSLMRMGSKLETWVRARRFKSSKAFYLMLKYIDDVHLGCFELGMWSSRLGKGMWGHSVVGYKIEKFRARRAGGDSVVDAYRVAIYDNNDPADTSDDSVWYFPSERLMTPSAEYASFYDGDNPLLPKGSAFLKPSQIGPGIEDDDTRLAGVPLTRPLSIEQNLMNALSLKYEEVSVTQIRGH